MKRFLIRLRYITIVCVFAVPMLCLILGMFLGFFTIPCLASEVSNWFWLLFLLYPVAATVVSVLFSALDHYKAKHANSFLLRYEEKLREYGYSEEQIKAAIREL